jgi:hypothetical protein
LNTTSNEVFYRPRDGEDMASAWAFAPALEELVVLKGTASSLVKNISFIGINFEYSNWLFPNDQGFVGDQGCVGFLAPLPDDEITSYPGLRHPAAVRVEAADNIAFERNVFHHLGSSGVNFYTGVINSQFIGNVIADASACGIAVDLNLQGNPVETWKICRNIRIRNNYITGIGRDYFQAVAISATYTQDTLIENNEIHDTSYSGISIGWGWDNVPNAAHAQIVRLNNIYDTNKMMSDGAGIYTLSHQEGSEVVFNYVHDIVRTSVQGGFNISGIYLDEGSNLIRVENNVLLRTADRPFFRNGNSNPESNNNGTVPPANVGLESAYRSLKTSYPAPPPQAPAPPDTIAPAPPTNLHLR